MLIYNYVSVEVAAQILGDKRRQDPLKLYVLETCTVRCKINKMQNEFNYCLSETSTRLFIWMHESNTIKLHVKFFLMMNTWLIETCRKHNN
jgi:hypothetical protein